MIRESTDENRFIRPKIETPAATRTATPTSHLLSGKGLMTAWDASAANGRGADYVILQADPEGNPQGFKRTTEMVLVWEARPLRGMEAVSSLGAQGYVAQAENVDEFNRAMAIDIHVTKYLCGKPDAWGRDDSEWLSAMEEAQRKGWGLLIEWYWGTNPSMIHGPDSKGYPVDSCLFQCTDEGNRRYLDEYLAIWHGSFCVYLPEQMTERDWQSWHAHA